MPRAGAGRTPNDGWHGAQYAAARWVESFCASGYGPHGGWKAIDGVVSTSPARAILDLGPTGPPLRPYVELARALDDANGDGATTGLLIASSLVRRGLDAVADVLGPAPLVEGLHLARRQTLAVLSSLARPDPDGRSLVPVAGPAMASAVLALLEEASSDQADPARGPLDLDAVDVVVDPQGPASHEGVLVRGEGRPRTLSGSVIIVGRGPRLKSEGAVVRQAQALPDLVAWEDAQVEAWCQDVAGRGVVLVASPGTLGGTAEGDGSWVAQRLRSRGVLVWEDAPKDALQRLAVVTGAEAGTRLEDARPGRGALQQRRWPRQGWWVSGAGAGWTLLVAESAVPVAASAVDEGRRLLRAAGAWREDPRGLPGAGAWQTEVEKALRTMAALAPGTTPLGAAVAAEAFAGLVSALATNAGGDPLRRPRPDGDVVDGFAATRHASAAAFETAIAQLRIDAAFAKAPSSTRGLRGSSAAPGSPLGMPGDLPPLM